MRRAGYWTYEEYEILGNIERSTQPKMSCFRKLYAGNLTRRHQGITWFDMSDEAWIQSKEQAVDPQNWAIHTAKDEWG
jgi:hypothetical protein